MYIVIERQRDSRYEIVIAPRYPAPPQVERSGGPKLRLLKLRGLREEKPSPTRRGLFSRSRLYPLFWVRGSFKKAQIAVIPIIALVGFWREATRRGLALRAKRSRTWQARSGTSPPQLARSGLDGRRDGVHRSWQRGSAALFRWLQDLA